MRVVWELGLDARPALSRGELLAVIAVGTFSNAAGVASPSQTTIGRLIGRGDRTVRNAVKAAQRAGIFARTRLGTARGRTTYTFATPTVAQARRAFALPDNYPAAELPVCADADGPVLVWEGGGTLELPLRPETAVAGLTHTPTARPAIPALADRQSHLPLKTPEEEKPSGAGAGARSSARPEGVVAGLAPIPTARPAKVPQASPPGAAGRARRPEGVVAGLTPTPTGRAATERTKVLHAPPSRTQRWAAYEVIATDFRPPWPATPPALAGTAARIAAYYPARPAIPEALRAEGLGPEPTGPPPDAPEPES